jgi:HEXXH motif-containing protein
MGLKGRPMLPSRHIVRRLHLAELASGGGRPETLTFLRGSEYSRRLLLLRAIRDAVVERPELLGPLPDIDLAWNALSTAQARDPERFRDLVLHPQLGSWATHTLRHRHDPSGGIPRWVDFGQIHAMALTAAHRIGVDLRTSVPVRDGHVTLPGLGQARFPGAERWAVAAAVAENGRLHLRHGDTEVTVPDDPCDDGPGWWGLRRISVGAGAALTVSVEDLDPFRDLADPEPPARLDGAAFDRWRSLLDGAWRILCRNHRDTAEAIAVGVSSLVPLPAGGWATRSASSGDAFGAMLVSPPPDPTTLAVALVHEFQHMKLGCLLHLCTLHADDDASVLYAPWRDDPRPVGGMLQGGYAFFGIARFWRDEWMSMKDVAAQFEYVFAREQTAVGLQSLHGAAALSAIGASLVADLVAATERWRADIVTPEIERLATLAVAAHRTDWRLRHLMTGPDEVAATIAAHSTGRPAHIRLEAPVRTGRTPLRWEPGRLPLLRVAALQPQAVRAAARSGMLSDVPGVVTAADVDLALGDPLRARPGFSDLIRKDPGSDDHWIGLALTFDPESAVRERPDLLKACYPTTGDTPQTLAEWFDLSGRASRRERP